MIGSFPKLIDFSWGGHPDKASFVDRDGCFYCKLKCRLNVNESVEKKSALKKERFVSKVTSLLRQHTFLLVHFFDVIACKQSLFYFSFRSFQKQRRARERSERTRTSAELEKELRWRSINLPRFIFHHARSTDFEEKIEGL